MRGYPYWPGVIESITEKGKYRIHFFGDFSRADINATKMLHFFDGFHQYESNYGNIKLKKAVEEAKILLFSKHTDKTCFICDILAAKKSFNKSFKQ